jgi:ribosome-associated translation inhibitor RaiA
MQISVAIRYLKFTDFIDSYIRKKIAKYHKIYAFDNNSVGYTISPVEKNRYITEFIFRVVKILFRAKERFVNLCLSINLVVNKFEKLLKKK